ncbi:unnamed protein product [Linum trigynum]|uniref:Uncharacterized protein n=1 Tax=Linum trigynum TaxID=586398 RepID=A0AAV2EV40_9ROSI
MEDVVVVGRVLVWSPMWRRRAVGNGSWWNGRHLKIPSPRMESSVPPIALRSSSRRRRTSLLLPCSPIFSNSLIDSTSIDSAATTFPSDLPTSRVRAATELDLLF